jgi:hypothetical protein
MLGEGEGALADWTHDAKRSAPTLEMNIRALRSGIGRV